MIIIDASVVHHWSKNTPAKMVEEVGAGMCVKRSLTDPLYLMIWGPRVPGSRLFDCVVRNTQRAQWKAALLWDGQLSPSGSNVTVTHTSTSRVIRIQKSGCVVHYQTERNVHALARSAVWKRSDPTRTGFPVGATFQWSSLWIKKK